MAGFLKNVFTHQGEGWWDLPKTQWQEVNPTMEGPCGDGGTTIHRWWSWMSAAGMHHGTPIFYTIIGVILAVITIVEVWAFTIEELGSMLIPVMLVLAIAKFVLVVAFFMHLRFDRKYYAWVFGACMVLGAAVFAIALALTTFHPGI